MQQGFGVALRLRGKGNENKMFSSVPWNLYGYFVVFMNIMGIAAVNLLKCSARDGSLWAEVCWMLSLKLLLQFYFFLLSWNIFVVASSAVGGTLELKWICHFWINHSRESPGGTCPAHPPQSTPGTCGPWAGGTEGHSHMGREVTRGISWPALWAG